MIRGEKKIIKKIANRRVCLVSQGGQWELMEVRCRGLSANWQNCDSHTSVKWWGKGSIIMEIVFIKNKKIKKREPLTSQPLTDRPDIRANADKMAACQTEKLKTPKPKIYSHRCYWSNDPVSTIGQYEHRERKDRTREEVERMRSGKELL